MPNNSKRQLVQSLAADLAEESRELTAVLARLLEPDWDLATPAEGWTVRDQVAHLAYFDDATLLSLRDRPAFSVHLAEMDGMGERFPDVVAERYRKLPGAECLGWLSRSRAALLAEFLAADPSARLPWYGPDMGVASSVTARLMETWAHGQDIRDALGVAAAATPRLRHIADLGVRTLAFSFRQRGLPVPAEPVLVRLTGPSGPGSPGGSGGETWTWGPPGAADRVEGGILDFCLVVTQRRNIADTGLVVTGPAAAAWIAIAQAFAGRPTDPRPAGLFKARTAVGEQAANAWPDGADKESRA